MNKHLENKIDKTLQSIDGIERATGNPFLYGKIMNKMNADRKAIVYTGKVVFRYAFLVLVLAGINFFTLYKKEKNTKEKMISEAFASEYFINSKTFEY